MMNIIKLKDLLFEAKYQGPNLKHGLLSQYAKLATELASAIRKVSDPRRSFSSIKTMASPEQEDKDIKEISRLANEIKSMTKRLKF